MSVWAQSKATSCSAVNLISFPLHDRVHPNRSGNIAEIRTCVLTVLYPEAAVSPGAPVSSFPPPPSTRCSATDDNNVTPPPSAHISEQWNYSGDTMKKSSHYKSKKENIKFIHIVYVMHQRWQPFLTHLWTQIPQHCTGISAVLKCTFVYTV